MHVKSNPQRDLAQVVAHCGCVLLEYNQQPTCQRNGTDPLSIPATGASSQNTSNTTDTRAYAKNETSPTSTSTVDLEDSFRKYTDTVMGVYGSDSIHSSNSDDSTDFYLRGTASPEGVDTILVKGIGSHLEQGDTGNSSDGQLDALSTLQHGENCGFSESLGRKYAPMCLPEVTEGQRLSVFPPPEDSAIARRHIIDNLYSLDLITRGTEEFSCQLSSPSTKGRNMARNISVAQEDLESQQPFHELNKGRARAARSPIKRFIVCALGVAVLLMFYTMLQVT